MKRKGLIITTICLAIALCIAAIGLTFAWYTNRTGVETGMILNANGVLVVYFDEDVKEGDSIKPAVARPGAIRDNVTEFDVLNGDENIVETAKVSAFESIFRYMNETGEASGSAQEDITMRCSAKMVFSDGSDMELSLVYDLGVEVEASGKYIGTEEEFVVPPIKWGEPFTVKGNADITLKIKVYFLQPDELCTPYLLGADKIEVMITMTAGNEAVQP